MALVYRIATGQAHKIEDTREYKEHEGKGAASNGYSHGVTNNKSRKQKIGYVAIGVIWKYFFLSQEGCQSLLHTNEPFLLFCSSFFEYMLFIFSCTLKPVFLKFGKKKKSVLKIIPIIFS